MLKSDPIQKLRERAAELKAGQKDTMPAVFKRFKKAPNTSKKNTPVLSPATLAEIKGTSSPYAQSLTPYEANHLVRRVGFGASPKQVDALVNLDASAAVAKLIEEAITREPMAPPTWVDFPLPGEGATQDEIDAFINENIVQLTELRLDWAAKLRSDGLRERMTLFWHNHFVTQVDTYFLATHAYRYIHLLETFALGNFKDLVSAMGLNVAMLKYLDSDTNRVGAPNENYGRELLELFTMGQKDRNGEDNYSQEDIGEAARALTGWVIDYQNHQATFIPNRFDASEKTFLGRTGNWGYNDINSIIFEERGEQIAWFICRKLFSEFVYAEPDDTMVDAMAEIFLDNNWEVEPVLQLLFSSEYFFDPLLRGGRIKSPVELIIGHFNDAGIEEPTYQQQQTMVLFSAFLQQELLNPPNVAGWPGHRTWISTTSLPIRWLMTDFLLFGDGQENQPVDFTNMAREFSEATDPNAAFLLPLKLAQFLLPVPLETLSIPEPAEEFGGDLINYPIPDFVTNGPAYGVSLAKVFLAGIPWYEWNIEEELAYSTLLFYIRYLSQIPEYHLT